jgi:hypothetical protein
MEWEQKHAIPWSFDPRCTKCGGRYHVIQGASDAPGVCRDCYEIYDMARFLEGAPPPSDCGLRCGWGVPGDPQQIMDAYHAYQRMNLEG